MKLKRPTRNQLVKGWYTITNASGAGSAPATVHLYDEIGYWGTSAGDFIDELRGVKADAIELRVNSPGGEIFDGFAIYNAIAAHPAHVTGWVDGLAASAASFIVQAADVIKVQEVSRMMIHDGIGFAFGNAKDMRALADQLESLSGQIANIYAARTGVPAAHWREAMMAETWYSAEEAVASGLADEVVPMIRHEGGADNSAPANLAPDDALRKVWDLSVFRYAGRDKAPAPDGPEAKRQPTPVAEVLFDWLTDHAESSRVDDENPLAALGR
jgi:ATP-dependent Clp endopeptidase proteolytic subunit ClpP